MTGYLYPAGEANSLLQETVKELAKAERRIEELVAVADAASEVHCDYVNGDIRSLRKKLTVLGKALTALDARKEAP